MYVLQKRKSYSFFFFFSIYDNCSISALTSNHTTNQIAESNAKVRNELHKSKSQLNQI